MCNSAITIFTAICLTYATTFAQSIAVDLADEAGIQSKVTSTDTSATIGVAIRLAGVSQISSYQYKVYFDTSRFTFIGAQQDFGITGEKNILEKNGGSIIGIAQLQLNPPAKDTVEFSYTVTGNATSTLVSGDGLAGVLYLKSKVSMGDSAAIMVSNCILADFDQNQITVTSYGNGTYSVSPITWAIRQPQNNKNYTELSSSVLLSILNRNIRFDIPSLLARSSKMVSFTLYTIDGKFLTGYQTATTGTNVYTLSRIDQKLFNEFEKYLCCLKIGSRNYSQIVSFHR